MVDALAGVLLAAREQIVVRVLTAVDSFTLKGRQLRLFLEDGLHRQGLAGLSERLCVQIKVI